MSEQFPMFKLGTLIARQISSPIATRIKVGVPNLRINHLCFLLRNTKTSLNNTEITSTFAILDRNMQRTIPYSVETYVDDWPGFTDTEKFIVV